ncbi:MAG TPA: hypothetical protein V6D47_06700, partial [Oscillatoriaceae cyanobacterium]
MRTARCILALAVLATGCQAIAPTSPTKTSRRVVSPHVTATSPNPDQSVAPTTAPPTDVTRIVDTGSAVDLIGKVKLISDKGLGIISNNGSGIISNNSGGYRVLDTALQESTLTNATIEVLDGDG